MGGAGWRYPSVANPAPVPTQERALDTIRAAIDATVELLGRLPEPQVTLEAIRRRSGVSQGSLTHHFGGRDGLIATAQVERFARASTADESFRRPLTESIVSPVTFSNALLDMLDEMLTRERHEVRWIRMSAIAAAFGDADLSETLSHHFTRSMDDLTSFAAVAKRSGLLRDDIDPRTVSLLAAMHAQGLVLDDLVGDEVPPSAWNHIHVEFVACFLTDEVAAELRRLETERFGDLWRSEVFGEPGRIPAQVAERLEELRDEMPSCTLEAMVDPERARALLRAEQGSGPDGSPRHRPSLKAARVHVFRRAIAALREHGAKGVDVGALRAEADLSAQSFHRLFGSQEAFLRELRIELEIARAAHSTARFANLVATSPCPRSFREALEAEGIRMADDMSRRSMWQRVETLSASRTDPQLRAALASVQQVTRDLLIEQVCLAQTRGLIDPDLPARGVARFLDGVVFWHVFHGMDAKRPAREDWTGMLRRIARMLSAED